MSTDIAQERIHFEICQRMPFIKNEERTSNPVNSFDVTNAPRTSKGDLI